MATAALKTILLSTPGIIFNLATASVTDSTITLTFQRTASATHFEYQVSNVSGRIDPFAWSALPSNRTITGLDADTQYFIRVRGVNGQLRGHYSNETMAVTLTLFNNVAAFWQLSDVSDSILRVNGHTSTLTNH